MHANDPGMERSSPVIKQDYLYLMTRSCRLLLREADGCFLPRKDDLLVVLS